MKYTVNNKFSYHGKLHRKPPQKRCWEEDVPARSPLSRRSLPGVAAPAGAKLQLLRFPEALFCLCPFSAVPVPVPSLPSPLPAEHTEWLQWEAVATRQKAGSESLEERRSRGSGGFAEGAEGLLQCLLRSGQALLLLSLALDETCDMEGLLDRVSLVLWLQLPDLFHWRCR